MSTEPETIGKKLRSNAVAIFTSVSRVNEWAVAVLVLAFVALLLLPGFSSSYAKAPHAPPPAEREPATTMRTVTVSAGDTLVGILASSGIDGKAADNVLSFLSGSFGARDLKPGQEITLRLRADTVTSATELAGLRIEIDPTKEIEALRTAWGGYTVRVIPHALAYRPVLVRGEITSTLYDSASSAGLPIPALMEMIRAFSFDVDFQRDVHPGNSYEVLFERAYDSHDRLVELGSVRYAALRLDRSTLRIYDYTTTGGTEDYFNEKGRSVRKTLIRTPINGAWISSGYGYRMDPIYGYTKFHPALDFAAPVGTPIIAAGDGTVVVAGYNSDYGNYVTIRHRNEYSTLYAHMSSFARGVRPGATVTQGQIIGFVGLTGLTTGPHLHYEVMWRGEHVNPATVVSPPGPVLQGGELARFLEERARLDASAAALGGTL